MDALVLLSTIYCIPRQGDKNLIFYKGVAYIKADMHYCELMGGGLILTSQIHFLIMVLSQFSQDMDVKNPRLCCINPGHAE